MLAEGTRSRLVASLLCSMLLHVWIFSLDGGYGVGSNLPTLPGPLIVTEFRRPVLPDSLAELPVPTAVREVAAPAQRLAQSPVVGEQGQEKNASRNDGKSSPLPVKYYSRSELNRYPVLLTPLPTDIGQDPELIMLQPGEAIFRVFINTEGVVVLVEPEESNLPVVLTQRARQILMKARFMPGYWSGNPVPSMLRWRFDIVPNMQTNLQIREVESK